MEQISGFSLKPGSDALSLSERPTEHHGELTTIVVRYAPISGESRGEPAFSIRHGHPTPNSSPMKLSGKKRLHSQRIEDDTIVRDISRCESAKQITIKSKGEHRKKSKARKAAIGGRSSSPVPSANINPSSSTSKHRSKKKRLTKGIHAGGVTESSAVLLQAEDAGAATSIMSAVKRGKQRETSEVRRLEYQDMNLASDDFSSPPGVGEDMSNPSSPGIGPSSSAIHRPTTGFKPQMSQCFVSSSANVSSADPPCANKYRAKSMPPGRNLQKGNCSSTNTVATQPLASSSVAQILNQQLIRAELKNLLNEVKAEPAEDREQSHRSLQRHLEYLEVPELAPLPKRARKPIKEDDIGDLEERYPLETRLLNGQIVAIAKDEKINARGRNERLPYVFLKRKGWFRPEYQFLYQMCRFDERQFKRFLG